MLGTNYIDHVEHTNQTRDIHRINKSGLNAEIHSAAEISMQHKIVNMPDPQSHHNPQPKRSSSSGTLNTIHTVKQSMPRSWSNGCSLNWFTPSEFFQFSQLAGLTK